MVSYSGSWQHTTSGNVAAVCNLFTCYICTLRIFAYRKLCLQLKYSHALAAPRRLPPCTVSVLFDDSNDELGMEDEEPFDGVHTIKPLWTKREVWMHVHVQSFVYVYVHV